jgi:2-amino-1-hydroxyethylphosphonate dioxygenase (glycine-forming)
MRIIDLYRQHGDAEYIGEPVSQLEHACQSGLLALRANADPEVVLAAFLHDIGHLCATSEMTQMDGLGTLCHEKIGAEYLRAHGLPERIAQLVESHVDAKRYLTFKDPVYFQNLSEASKQTLRWQGGPMTADEALAFEKNPDFETMLLLRRWDEAAKEEGQLLPDLAVFETLIAAVTNP